jgi:PKD repeat protein
MIMKNRIIITSFIAILLSFSSCRKNEAIPLTVDFTASSQTIGAGENIDFFDNSVGQPSSWSWTFEGGTPQTSNASGPTVTYELPGTYAVTLEIKYGDQSSIEKKVGFITVGYNDVSPEFEASATTATQDETLKFTDKTTGLPTTWKWEFKSTTGNIVLTSTLQNPEIKFTEPGLYDVKLIVSNPKSTKELVKAGYINIIDKFSVDAQFESDINATYTGGQVSFTDKSIGNATAWNWTFEGATQVSSTVQNPVVTYNTPGRHKVKLVVSNVAKSSTLEIEKYILVVPGGNLAGFYPFNGNSNDVGPNKLNPNQVGNGVAITFDGADRKLSPNKTAVFKGSKAFVVPDHASYNFGTTNYTISCWIKTSNTSKLFIFAESGGKGSGDNQTWGRIGNNTTTQLIQLAVEQAGTGNSAFVSIGTDGKVSDNNWNHLTFVREGRTTRVYINGVKKGEATSVNLVNVSNEGDFKIGAQEGTSGFGSFFIGQMDDMIIYRKALTEAEVQALFNL